MQKIAPTSGHGGCAALLCIPPASRPEDRRIPLDPLAIFLIGLGENKAPYSSFLIEVTFGGYDTQPMWCSGLRWSLRATSEASVHSAASLAWGQGREADFLQSCLYK